MGISQISKQGLKAGGLTDKDLKKLVEVERRMRMGGMPELIRLIKKGGRN